MKTNIDNVLNDIQSHKFYENAFCALARYYNNVIDTIQIIFATYNFKFILN